MTRAIAIHHGRFGRCVFFRPYKSLAMHAHRESHLIFVLNGGYARMSVCSEMLELDDFAAVAVNSWEPHKFDIVEGRDPGLCLALYIDALPRQLGIENGTLPQTFGARGLQLSAFERTLVHQLANAMQAQQPPLVELRVRQLISRCHDTSWQGSTGVYPSVDGQAHFSDYRIRKATKLMHESILRYSAVEDLAREVGLSRPHFYRLFKQQTGVTPNLYHNTIRTEYAISQLIETNAGLTDIGYELGFATPASFSRFFAENTGVTPRDYRRLAQTL